ncbi:MAG TPA: cysteine desulfurase family protein [Gemmatimonadaceae bacterium]|nr:cysteine desulfurase family protein [Gemmatimonadaceae bacterium]
MPQPVYLDHAATTPVHADVVAAMEPFFGPRFGNPSSTHRWGREARVALDEARERLAACLGAHPDEICFTSGGTEGDNFAVLGAWRATRATAPRRRAVVTSVIEHKAVLGAVHQAAHEGAEERLLPVTPDGVIDMDAAAAALTDDVAVCSVMWVNNEVGTLQPVESIVEMARAHGILVHTDAVQAFGKAEIDVRRLAVDVLTISGHKIGAPKGIGALFLRRDATVEPLLHGGGQNRGRRPGTENVPFAVGLARAAELTVQERERETARLRALRDVLERTLLERIPDAVVHGRNAPRAPHILNLSVPGTDSESLLMALDLAGVACSSGSACQSGSVDPSHVLSAMGVPRELATAAIRMSLGVLTTEACVQRVGELFPALVAKARRLSGATG